VSDAVSAETSLGTFTKTLSQFLDTLTFMPESKKTFRMLPVILRIMRYTGLLFTLSFAENVRWHLYRIAAAQNFLTGLFSFFTIKTGTFCPDLNEPADVPGHLRIGQWSSEN